MQENITFLTGIDRNLCMSFHFAQQAGADEGIEAEIGFVAACVGIDGCIGFGLFELGFEAVLPILERSKVFGRRDTAMIRRQ